MPQILKNLPALTIAIASCLGTSWVAAAQPSVPEPPHTEDATTSPFFAHPTDEQHIPVEIRLHLSDSQAKLFESVVNTAHAYHYVDPVALHKLTTPERLAKMRIQRQARDQQLESAVQAFYAALDEQQKKIFDSQSDRLLGPPMGPQHTGAMSFKPEGRGMNDIGMPHKP